MRWRDAALTALALAGLVFPAQAADPVVGPVLVSDPTAAPQPKGGATVLAMTIANNGDITDHLIRAACPDAGSVTFEAQDEAATPHQVEGFEIPARKAVVLGAGGWRIVLHDLGHAVAAGDILPCTVTFERAGEQIVQARVQE